MGIEIDPTKQNIFQVLVDEKERHKQLKDGMDKAIKILINAASYGIFIELQREENKVPLSVYSGNNVFADNKKVERRGKYFFPIIATLITDGSKLLLGIGDILLKKYNEVVAYCDTDSMAVPTKYKDEIIAFYDPLNPYKIVKHLLKEDEQDILLYAISAKRYCLYQLDEHNQILINEDDKSEDYSLHGLGHLSNPFGNDKRHWQKQVWEDILKLHQGIITYDQLMNKYRNFYAISQFTVSTAKLRDRFELLNKNKSYTNSIKPFGFFNIGFGNVEGVKPIASFSKDPQTMVYNEFIDYKTGKKMRGQRYFKSLADELDTYIKHPESKLEGDVGILERRYVVVDKISYIGKEADKIADIDNGLDRIDYNTYEDPAYRRKLFLGKWKDAKGLGVSRRQFYRIKRELKSTINVK